MTSSAWKYEDQDFTPWLAQEENLRLLGKTIGFDLELEAQEKDVDPFRADILCKDTLTGNWVLIESISLSQTGLFPATMCQAKAHVIPAKAGIHTVEVSAYSEGIHA